MPEALHSFAYLSAFALNIGTANIIKKSHTICTKDATGTARRTAEATSAPVRITYDVPIIEMIMQELIQFNDCKRAVA